MKKKLIIVFAVIMQCHPAGDQNGNAIRRKVCQSKSLQLEQIVEKIQERNQEETLAQSRCNGCFGYIACCLQKVGGQIVYADELNKICSAFVKAYGQQ